MVSVRRDVLRATRVPHREAVYRRAAMVVRAPLLSVPLLLLSVPLHLHAQRRPFAVQVQAIRLRMAHLGAQVPLAVAVAVLLAAVVAVHSGAVVAVAVRSGAVVAVAVRSEVAVRQEVAVAVADVDMF